MTKAVPEVRHAAGTLADGLANGWRLVARDPRSARLQAEVLIRSAPGSAAAFRLLAAALEALGLSADAERAQLDAVRVSLADPRIAAAARAIATYRLGEAEHALRAFLADSPDDAAALMLLGDMIGRNGYFRAGEEMLERALKSAPAYLDARMALANLLFLQVRSREAMPHSDYVLERQPGNVSTLRFKATLLGQLGDHEASLAIFDDLIAANGEIVALLIGRGDTLRTLGRKEEAEQSYRRAIAADPAGDGAWWSLATLRASPLGDTDIAAMERLAATVPPDGNRYHLYFALGIAYEDRGDRETSFRHYAEGNRIRAAMQPYDAPGITREVERSERELTAPFFAKRVGWGNPSPAPIFILGMPRSGSTLVEQILSSHPLIEGTAELPAIPILIQTMAGDHRLGRGDSWRELLPKVPREELTALGGEYLDRVAALRKTDRPWFIDKLPHNWADIAFIHLALPNARIIDIRRNPLDCCFSNFKLLFAQGHPSASSLEGMASYYRDYVRLMRHLDSALPGRIHRIIYEELVDDLEGETRRLLAHIGADFDPACLDFHRTERAVATASSEQVRRPLNREGIGAWHKYEPWLGPLVEALGDLPQTYRA